MESIFKIENLNCIYGYSKKNQKQSLFNINLEINANRVTALIGPSGCGKSTFLNCLNRMNDLIENCHIEGKIFFEGKDIYEKDKMGRDTIDIIDLRSRVGMIFQKPNPFPMSIFDNIAYGPRCRGMKNKKDIHSIVEKTLIDSALFDDVKDRLKDNAMSLSGGQQQRLCIARALATSPEVILMDEPTSALDPIATAKIEGLIDSLRQKYTIVIVTHSMQQAARVSDYTAFFLMGNLIETDETKKIFKNPLDKRTEDYITGRFG